MDDLSKRQARMKSVLTCGICKKLCKDVSIVEECCHRFCKNCIMEKVKEEKLKVCPQCHTDLGAAPLQKIRPDHQVQGIRDMVSNKRRELIKCGLIEKSKKGELKKLAPEESDLNEIPVMLMDILPSPPPPAPLVVGTSLRRKEKPISSTKNATPLLHDDQLLNQQNISNNSTGRERGRGRGRRVCSQHDANVDPFQDPSIFNDVVDLNKGNTHPGSLTQHNQQIKGDQPRSSSVHLLSVKATQLKQEVESSVYADDSSKSDSISNKDISIEPFNRMNDLSKARAVNEDHHIWFTLIACDKQEGPSPLPQISTRYIKIKDVNKPSSYLKKYLAQKLSLQSEDEVELRMLGMLIRPELPLKHLEKLWLRVAPHSTKRSVTVGASAEEFVMILKYSRSHPELN
ncbi:E3 ubiquitin protein ligase DRIP1-like [Solanum pennellii]|uniref:E3 ubiquitin protein ligase DRIP1-like n=1 Tax=Solanum pennellii TaxID=28526 RepID=A0ABM1HLC8_SOLPN|nr:E3 ubiquitin protein ligase DRIP1-like [Solanum pennellii]